MIFLSDNKILSDNSDVTPDTVFEAVTLHREKVLPDINKAKDYYQGKHAILNRQDKGHGKPNNKIVNNYPKSLANEMTSFMVSDSPTMSSTLTTVNSEIQKFFALNRMDVLLQEVVQDMNVTGRAYLQLWKDSYQHVSRLNPQNTFLVRLDNPNQETLFAVTYYKGYDGNIKGQAFTKDEVKTFYVGNDDALIFTDIRNNIYLDIPVIEIVDGKGVFFDAISQIDAINDIVSDKVNDSDYFSNAYLWISGARMTRDDIANINDNRLINTTSPESKVQFLDKPTSGIESGEQIKWLEKAIYETSEVAQITGVDFGNSGVSLEVRYQPMEQAAKRKESIIKGALQILFKNVLFLQSVADDSWTTVDIKFHHSKVRDYDSEIKRAVELSGIVSKRRLLGQLSFIPDVDEELKQIKKEQQEEREDFDPEQY